MLKDTDSRESILNKEYCSKKEAAAYLRISTTSIEDLLKEGLINAKNIRKKGKGYIREYQTASLVLYEIYKDTQKTEDTPSSLLNRYKSTTKFRPVGGLTLREGYEIFISRTFRKVTYHTFEGWCHKGSGSRKAYIYTVTCGFKGGQPDVYILTEELDNFIDFYNNEYPKKDDRQNTFNVEDLTESQVALIAAMVHKHMLRRLNENTKNNDSNHNNGLNVLFDSES